MNKITQFSGQSAADLENLLLMEKTIQFPNGYVAYLEKSLDRAPSIIGENENGTIEFTAEDIKGEFGESLLQWAKGK